MLILILDAVMAAVFAGFARYAYRRGWPLVHIGWVVIDATVQHEDYRTNIESRRVVSEAGILLISGILWLTVMIGTGATAVYFGLRVFAAA
ncbi:MAG: hypothetical protein ACOCX3_01340 [Chloroflexota bacterium]